jgi:CheY-like chemotaxis protein
VSLENAHLYELSQQARNRVEAATRAKDEFVAMVSHELRTPLNVILGWLRLQRSGVLTPEKSVHALDVVERNASALNGLVADLLDVSRILTRSIRLSLSLVDLPTVVEQAVEGIRPVLEARRIGLTLSLSRGRALIRADAERLQQVIWNLLSNAIKFTQPGGRIEVSVRHVNSHVELEVRDTGSGISPEFLPHVFESFRQWESGSTRRHAGLGIGLSIARHIVELHGGSITAASEGLNRGSTFAVRLPIASSISTEAPRAVPAARPPSLVLPAGLEGLRVLVVDDEEDARDLLGVLLQASGIEVRAADSAERGIIALEEFTPDVVVSDVAIPGEDGYALIRRIRTLPSKLAETPVIALTAHARSEDRSRALVEGFNAYLSKPVEPADLLAAIADLAGRPQAPST